MCLTIKDELMTFGAALWNLLMCCISYTSYHHLIYHLHADKLDIRFCVIFFFLVSHLVLFLLLLPSLTLVANKSPPKMR